MPAVKKGEKERDYIKRCVPVLIHEGKEHDQAVAVCYGMWDEHQKKMQLAKDGGLTFSATSLARISPGAGEFMPALTLGQDWPYPKERNGKPCFYYWKPALTLGHKTTWGTKGKPGKPIESSPERVATIVSDYKRAAAAGYEAPLPDDHRNPTKNYGWIKDARIGKDGALELLHQFVGEEEKNEALNKKTSICTIENVTDEHDNEFSELIDHNAIIINPQLNDLGDFTPALAASRGQAIEAVQFEMSAPQETVMVLKKTREVIGAAPDVTDEKLDDLIVAKLGEGTKALELSRTSGDALKTEKDRADKAEKERDTLNAKVLELSRTGAPDPVMLEDRRMTGEEILTGFVERGQCSDAMAKIIRENFLGVEGKPCLLLSRGARSGEVGAVFKLLELNKALSGFQQTGGQSVPRSIPGANGEPDLGAVGLKQGQDWQAGQLAARNLK